MIQRLRGLFYGWWIIIASFILFATVGGVAYYGFTAFFTPIAAEMGWTSTQTSLAFSLRSVEGGIVQPVIGFVVDRVGPRFSILIGVLVMGSALILMSQMRSLGVFYAVFVMFSLGITAGLGIPQYTAVVHWFKRRRSIAMGVLSAGFGVSGAMAPLLVRLIHGYGWRLTLTIVGITTIAIGVPLSLVVRHKPGPHGYLPDGDKATGTADSVRDAGGRGDPARGGFSVRQCLRTRAFWLIMVFGLLPSFSLSAIMVHEMPFLISVGVSEEVAALAVLGVTASSLLGRIGFSWLGDVYDKRYLLAIGCALQAVGVFLFASIRSPWMIIPFVLTYGPGYGAQIPLLAVVQADYFGTKAYALLRGLFGFGYVIPGILGPLLAGRIYDTRGSYHLGFLLFSILCAAAVPIILFIGRPPKSVQIT